MDLAQPEATELLSDLLATGRTAQFAVTGGSMRPLLAGGETVLVRRVLPAEICLGDLLLCRQPGPGGSRLLLHRVVRIRRRPGLPVHIQTHGDALWAPDPPVTEDAVLGRVYAILAAGPGRRDLSLAGRGRRIQGLLIALRQLSFWRVHRAPAALLRRLRSARLRTLLPEVPWNKTPR